MSNFSSFNVALYHHHLGLKAHFWDGAAPMNTGLNRFFFRETVQDSGIGDEKVIRQRGGIHLYAHVRVSVRALDRGEGVVFVWSAGSNIPAKFAPVVSRGIREAVQTGVLAGLELTDIRVCVEDGSYHEEDSTAEAFKEAAENATTVAIRKARAMILEAISLVTAKIPAKFLKAAEMTMTSFGADIVRSEEPTDSITASVPTRLVDELIGELLQISEGHAKISSAAAGSRRKSDPLDGFGKPSM